MKQLRILLLFLLAGPFAMAQTNNYPQHNRKEVINYSTTEFKGDIITPNFRFPPDSLGMIIRAFALGELGQDSTLTLAPIYDSINSLRAVINLTKFRTDSLIDSLQVNVDLSPIEDSLNVRRLQITANKSRLDSLISNFPSPPDLTPIEDSLILHKQQIADLDSRISDYNGDINTLTLDDILNNQFGNFAGGQKIVSLGTPDDPYDAANKIYVDGQLSTKLDNGDTTAIMDSLRLHSQKIQDNQGRIDSLADNIPPPADLSDIEDTLIVHKGKIQDNEVRIDSLVDNAPPPTDLTTIEDTLDRHKIQLKEIREAPSFTDFGLGGQLAPVPGNNLDTLRKSGLYYTDPGVIGRPPNSNDYGSVIHLENPNLGSATQFFANDSLYFRYRIYDGWQSWVKINSGSTGGVTAADLAAIEDSILIHRGEIDSLWSKPVPSISQVIGAGGIYQGSQLIELSHRNNGTSVSNSATLVLNDNEFYLNKTIYNGSVYSSEVRGDIGGLTMTGNSSQIEIMKDGIAVDVDAPQTGQTYSVMYYRNDYSSYFGDRSITDKAYVDRAAGRSHVEMTGSTYTVQFTDKGKTLYVTTANTTVTLGYLGAAGTVQVGDFIAFEDAGSGSITVDASAFTILDKDGNAIITGVSALPVSSGVFKWYGNDTFKFIGQ